MEIQMTDNGKKWLGTVLILISVALNSFNNPDLQKYVYPLNLYVSLLGSLVLLWVSKKQKDLPYVVLNVTVLNIYIIAIWNSFKFI